MIRAAELRDLLGDGFTAADYDLVGGLPPQPGSQAVCAAVESALEACCVPGLVLETDRPTTIGLGDTFAGGFVSALARGES
ncbi:carbohydrate kinase family protein [Rathayibacter sp. AY1A7]|uniref:carbohydrate kinase family protein n=1 Tax=Rathayibacter sp. AY1A7 TaxID=2080524 RepID=UPI0011AFDFAB|nr:carbohydrate kinase family protein [Rathayibacter sp. AY1A7]